MNDSTTSASDVPVSAPSVATTLTTPTTQEPSTTQESESFPLPPSPPATTAATDTATDTAVFLVSAGSESNNKETSNVPETVVALESLSSKPMSNSPMNLPHVTVDVSADTAKEEANEAPFTPLAADTATPADITSTTPGTPSSTTSTTTAAPQLMNRFRNFREKANQNAAALWAARKAMQQQQDGSTRAEKQASPLVTSSLANWKIPLRQASLDPPPPPPPPPSNNSNKASPATPKGRDSFDSSHDDYYDEQHSYDNSYQDDHATTDNGNDIDDDDHDDGYSYDTGDGDSSSYYDTNSSSIVTDGESSHNTPMFRAASLLTAANSVLDNAAGMYRGRYSAGSATGNDAGGGTTTTTPTLASATASMMMMNRLPPVSTANGGGTLTSSAITSTTPSQTARILGSRQAAHLQTLMESLQPQEYVMLLGRGMLGVNLKQSFLKGSGVHVDYLVLGGAADRSGVVRVGDAICAVGNVKVTKETIWTVPVQIAQAPRPVHLVLAVACPLSVQRVQWLDICVAMCHEIRKERGANRTSLEKETKEQEPVQATDDTQEANGEAVARDNLDESEHGRGMSQESVEAPDDPPDNSREAEADDEGVAVDADVDDSMELIQPPSIDVEDSSRGSVDVDIPIENTVDGFVNPAAPPLAVREAYQSHIAKRNNDGFLISQLSQAAASNENFRAALRNAFLTCTVDGRRFSFLARHLVKYEEDDGRDDNERSGAASAPNAMFMLFLEMFNFTDLYGVTPVSRRLDIARRIAQKFFLPTKSGKELIPPVFDFHHIVPVSSLRRLEVALSDTNESELPRDIFFDFQQAVADSLSGKPFISFLTSNECARMRAFLRGTAPFVNVPLKDTVDSLAKKPTDAVGKNYFMFLISYLLCRVDKEVGGEYDIVAGQPAGSRVEDAASGICATVFIRGVLLPLIEATQKASVDFGAYVSVISAFERFWEMFVAPGVGAIEHSSHSNETGQSLTLVRSSLEGIQSQIATLRTDTQEAQRCAVGLLSEASLLNDISRLADELLYDYAANAHSRFKNHKFYEWMCAELAKDMDAQPTLSLPSGCIKRLLRKADFPAGVSTHKPAHLRPVSLSKSASKEGNERLAHTNAECAVVFGTSVGLDLAAQITSPVMDQDDLRRYTCQSVGLLDEDSVDAICPEQLPSTLESYAVVPSSRPKAFGSLAEDIYLSADGWEASIVNFMIPRADITNEDGEEGSLYGVSLVFRRSLTTPHPVHIERVQTALVEEATASEGNVDNASVNTVETKNGNESDGSENQTRTAATSVGTPKRSNVQGSPAKSESAFTINSPIFNERLQERSWTERISREVRDDDASVTVGIALVSQRNVIFAMKETLVRLLRDFSREPEDSTSDARECGALVNILGNFAHQDVEAASLKCILEPFLRAASTPWLERPIASQKQAFEQFAGHQLIRSLPPIPLALMFVSALMEQKIVLSSSRRSILLSATVALQELLKPLKWCHLIVPRVPGGLAADLLQYPAPFILGMPSDDPGIMDLIRDLPDDVTLVDLDVGRVILAPSFAHNSEMGRGTSNNENTSRALRSQVLYLSQSLGSVFGARIDSQTWLCDQPLCMNDDSQAKPKVSEFDTLRSTCHGFIEELLAGTPACCYWVEEESSNADSKDTLATEPTVLFDEDRFFHIKNQRQRNGYSPLLPTLAKEKASSPLALGLDSFDLVLEVFLRCQSMNAYVSSRQRDEMLFSL